MRTPTFTLGALLVTTLFACSGQDERVTPIQSLGASLTAGRTGYDTHCASCHGSDGKGTGGSTRENVAAAAANDKAKAIDVVLSGEDRMPEFSALSNQEIADIIGYLASLK